MKMTPQLEAALIELQAASREWSTEADAYHGGGKGSRAHKRLWEQALSRRNEAVDALEEILCGPRPMNREEMKAEARRRAANDPDLKRIHREIEAEAERAIKDARDRYIAVAMANGASQAHAATSWHRLRNWPDEGVTQ